MNPTEPLGRTLIAAGAALAGRSGDIDRVLADLPFLADYVDADRRNPPVPCGPEHPVARLAAAGVSSLAIDMLLAAGLVEEDPRFLHLLGIGGDRPAFGQVEALFSRDGDSRSALLELLEAGLVECPERSASRPLWPVSVPSLVWDAMSQRLRGNAGFTLAAREDLLPLDAYLVPPDLAPQLAALPARLGGGGLLSIRGAVGNGRTTLAGAVARELGFGLLRIEPEVLADRSRWVQACAVATLMGAMPCVRLELAPGEERRLPDLGVWPGPAAVILGPAGAVRPDVARPGAAIELPRPDLALRMRHWRSALPEARPEALRSLAEGFRVTGGAIRAAAAFRNASGAAEIPSSTDVRAALRLRAAPRLETVATRIDPPLQPLLLASETNHAFRQLELRCRNSELLGEAADNALGVRALFAGPSGTGKTLAARTLADRLGRDLWRIDLAAAVSKWIGETEKNLERAFAAAEDHDAILLLDEGDALMSRRTEVSSANDRYANLETSYLLQRIERLEGVLIVTTNALERIDSAFSRRMDVVIRFPQPDAAARHAILLQHLGQHVVSDELLGEIAVRCTLSGGQLRNVALGARIEALANGGMPGDGELQAAVVQEYRKVNLPCPLKPRLLVQA